MAGAVAEEVIVLVLAISPLCVKIKMAVYGIVAVKITEIVLMPVHTTLNIRLESSRLF